VRQGRTAHDERDTCAAAARAHLVAADQAARGAMTPSAFAALDDAFDELAIRCRNSLEPLGETE
jgi:2-methylcitrate dehydratase PrpD